MNQKLTRTEFENKAYQQQHKTRNRVSGLELGSTYTPDTRLTRSDRHIILSVVGLILFIIMLMLV